MNNLTSPNSSFENLTIRGILETRRWWILIVFCLYSLSNATAFTTFSPIIQLSRDYFQATEWEVLWLVNVWYLSYIICATPIVKMFEWRLDASLIIGIFVNTLGGWLRFIAGPNYSWTLISQLVIALAQLFILPAPAFIAERWFSAGERSTATGLMFFSNVIGVSLGFLTSVYYITSFDDFPTYMAASAILMSLSPLPALFVIRDKPRIPANISSGNTEKLEVFQTLKVVFTNKSMLVITIALSIFQGISWTIISVINILLSDYGNEQIGLIGLCINVSGTIAGTISTLVLDKAVSSGKKPNYDLFIKLFATISILSMIMFSLFLQLDLQDNNKPLIWITSALLGIGFQSFVPISIQSFLETLYPMHEISCYTSFNIVANIFGLIGNLATSIQGIGTTGAWILVAMMLPLYIFLMVGYKTKTSRFAYEKQHYQSLVNTVHETLVTKT